MSRPARDMPPANQAIERLMAGHGELKIVAARYDLDTGVVELLQA